MAQIFPTEMAIKWLFNSHLTQHLFLHYLGKTELMRYYSL